MGARRLGAESNGGRREVLDGANDDVGPEQAGGDRRPDGLTAWPAPEVIDALTAAYPAHGVEFTGPPID